MMAFPKMVRVRQKFDCPRVDDIPGEVERQLKGLALDKKVKPGQSVAITVGSRGIANIALITKAMVQHFQRLGTKPFIVPAMGSHGGGTAEGQKGIINGYGVTEEAMGCEIRASMETVVVDQLAPAFVLRRGKDSTTIINQGWREPAPGPLSPTPYRRTKG